MDGIFSELQWGPLVGTVVYSIIGFIVMFVAYRIFDMLTPFSFHKEIEEDQNVALGIMVGSLFIAIAIIIAAAIRS